MTAAPLRSAGIAPLVPDRYRLGALIRLVSDTLTEQRVLRLRSHPGCGGIEIELRGRVVTVSGRQVVLGPNALALFKALAAVDTVVSRVQLQRYLPACR